MTGPSRLSKVRARSLALLLVACAIACNPASSSSGVEESLQEALTASPHPTEVDLGTIASVDWDRAFVFGPYTPQATIDATLGFAWPSREAEEIARSDAANLVVFVRDGDVIATDMLSRALVDVVAAQLPMRLDRDDSTLDVEWAGRVPLLMD